MKIKPLVRRYSDLQLLVFLRNIVVNNTYLYRTTVKSSSTRLGFNLLNATHTLALGGEKDSACRKHLIASAVSPWTRQYNEAIFNNTQDVEFCSKKERFKKVEREKYLT